jgi:hypothetical protein
MRKSVRVEVAVSRLPVVAVSTACATAQDTQSMHKQCAYMLSRERDEYLRPGGGSQQRVPA